MSSNATGPSATAQWERRVAGGTAGPAILTLADASAPEVLYALPAAPRLGLDGAGEPALTLTAILSRMPRADEPSIRELVERGHFGVTLTLAPPAIEPFAGEEIRPLF